MKKLEKLLESMSFAKSSGPVNAAEIQQHERKLKLQFGPTYTRFLSKYGCIAAGPNEIYGICGDNTSIPSAIHATLSARRDPQFPRHLLVIADDGSGRKVCVDSRDEIFLCDINACNKAGQSFEDFAVEWLCN